MFKVISAIVSSVLFFVLATSNAAHAATPVSEYWMNNNISINSYSFDKEYDQGQCLSRLVRIIDGSGKETSWEGCTVSTQWGGVFEENYIQLVENKPFAKLVLASGQEVLRAPESDKLFIKIPNSDGSFRIAYLLNPNSNLRFHSLSNTYTVSGTLLYLAGSFTAAGFSNTSSYLVGMNKNSLTRTSLTTMTSKTVSHARGFQDVVTISDDGLMVFSSNDDGTLYFYDLRTCMTSGGACATRMLAEDTMLSSYGKHSIYLDGQESVALYSYPRAREVHTVYAHVEIEKQNVSFMVLGDSFISGEGTFEYKEGTDGSEEYPNEKCHQAYDSYPNYYAARYPGGWGDRVTPGSQSISSMSIMGTWDF